jgi:hypothetical protein
VEPLINRFNIATMANAISRVGFRLRNQTVNQLAGGV